MPPESTTLLSAIRPVGPRYSVPDNTIFEPDAVNTGVDVTSASMVYTYTSTMVRPNESPVVTFNHRVPDSRLD